MRHCIQHALIPFYIHYLRRILVSLSGESDTTHARKRSWNSGKSVGSQRIFSDEAFSQLFNCFETNGSLRDRVFFYVWVNTAARGKDVRELLVSDVTAPNGKVHDRFRILQSKVKKPVWLFLLPETIALLEQYITETGKRRDDYLFTSTKGNHADENKPIGYTAHFKWFKKWLTRAGLPASDYGTHSIRRTKGRAVRLGSDIFAESKVLGHEDINTTMTYAGEDDEELRHASLQNDPIRLAQDGQNLAHRSIGDSRTPQRERARIPTLKPNPNRRN